jgi:hypothetical protein
MNEAQSNLKSRAVILLLVQVALVLSIAGKYLYERKTLPRVWVLAGQYDPNLPLRGRYLALQLSVDGCAFPRDKDHSLGGFESVNSHAPNSWRWNVKPVAQNGKLLALPASDTDRPEQTDELTVSANRPCNLARLGKTVEYFIPDNAQSPFPLKPHEELWVEVSVPPMGPPRPIQLAIAKEGAFTPLTLR